MSLFACSQGAKNKSGKDGNNGGSHGHDGKHGGGGNGKHSQGQRQSHGHHGAHTHTSKKEEIVPWGFEKAQKEEKRRRSEQHMAEVAARKAAREFDPAMAVAEKVKKTQPEERKGHKSGAMPSGGGATQL